MEADDRGGRDIRKAKQRLADRLAHVSIDRYCRECLSSLCQSSLVVFRDINPSFTQESTYPANYTWNVIVRENQERIPRLDIDVKRADPREPRQCAGLCSTGDCNLLHTTAQSHFNRIWVVLCRSLGRGEVDAATLRHCAGVDEIEPLLLYGSLEKPSRGRCEQRTSRRCERRSRPNVYALHRARALSREDGSADSGSAASQRQRRLDFSPLSADVGNIDRARQLSAQQRITHRDAHVYGNVPLRFRRGCSDVWRQQDIRQRSKRVVRGQWLFLVCIHDSAKQVLVFKRFDQRFFVDYSAPRHVDYDGALGKPRELPLADHPHCFVGERGMNGEDGRLLE